MLEANFLSTAIFGAFGGDCAEGLTEGQPHCRGHYVSHKVFGDIDKLGGFVGFDVGFEVGALADRSPCRLDGVVEKVGALIVREVVCFFDFTCEVVAENLFKVLPIVGVGAVDIGKSKVCHCGMSFRPLVLIL